MKVTTDFILRLYEQSSERKILKAGTEKFRNSIYDYDNDNNKYDNYYYKIDKYN